jgi:hypothetical protein
MNKIDLENGLAEAFMVHGYAFMIGKQVTKLKEGRQPKPFKSGLKVNTVKGIISHPILGIPAFTFLEDESYVECRRCQEV